MCIRDRCDPDPDQGHQQEAGHHGGGHHPSDERCGGDLRLSLIHISIPKKKKLKSEAEKVKEKAAKRRLGKAEITPEEVSRMTKAQKRELYACLLYTSRCV